MKISFGISIDKLKQIKFNLKEYIYKIKNGRWFGERWVAWETRPSLRLFPHRRRHVGRREENDFLRCKRAHSTARGSHLARGASFQDISRRKRQTYEEFYTERVIIRFHFRFPCQLPPGTRPIISYSTLTRDGCVGLVRII